jgi:hypothetical protein
MAADLLRLPCPNVEQLFALAREADFSNYGEIFSGMVTIKYYTAWVNIGCHF